MKPQEMLVQELIRSLNEEVDNWEFDDHTAHNETCGIKVWIANVPILNLSIWKPTEIKFSLIDRIRIYSAISNCRALKLLKLFNSRTR